MVDRRGLLSLQDVAFLLGLVLIAAVTVSAFAYVGGQQDTRSAGASVTTTATPTVTASTTTTAVDRTLNLTRVENLVHKYINQERREHGLSPLNHSFELRGIAGNYATDMGQQNFYGHESPLGYTFQDRYELADYECRIPIDGNRIARGAENIQYTHVFANVDTGTTTVYHDSEKDLAKALVENWMNSEGHRENILTPYWNNEGIGVFIVERPPGPAKKVYAVQNFC